jgi:hypothetical protein
VRAQARLVESRKFFSSDFDPGDIAMVSDANLVKSFG